MQLPNLTKKTREQKEQRHVIQSAFGKIRHHRDKVVS